MTSKRLSRRLAAIQRRIDVLSNLKAFVSQHPELIAYSDFRAATEIVNCPHLYFEDQGFIKALWDKKDRRAILQLEKYVTNWDEDGDASKRIVAGDISHVSREELAKLLLEIKIDLNSPPPGGEVGNDEDD
jgi:hypothetical protein